MKVITRRLIPWLKKSIVAVGVLSLSLAVSLAFFTVPTLASPWGDGVNPAPHSTHGWNSGEGRHGPVNANDFHTASWHRFGPMNYQFRSGPDWNQVFGRHTFASTFTPDTTFQNVRRDRHAAHSPLPYGIFSAVVSTPMVNPTFQHSVHRTNQQQPFIIQDPHIHLFTSNWHSPSSQGFVGHGSAWGQGGDGWGNGVGVATPYISSPGQGGGMLPHTSILD